jgi:uncharacterized membrane protein YidH (DUF202 family)
MHRIPETESSLRARFALRLPIALWIGVALSALSVAKAANPLAEAEPRNVEVLLVLLAGVGVLLVAAAVIAFAVRQLRRDAAERRQIYTYRRRGPRGSARPRATTD